MVGQALPPEKERTWFRSLPLVLVCVAGGAALAQVPAPPSPAGAALADQPPRRRQPEPALESRLVLRYKQMELRPDIKLFIDWQISTADGDNAFHLTRGYLGLKVKLGVLALRPGDARHLPGLGPRQGWQRAGRRRQGPGGGEQARRLSPRPAEVRLPRGHAAAVDARRGRRHPHPVHLLDRAHRGDALFAQGRCSRRSTGIPRPISGVAVFGHLRDYVDYAVGFYNGGGYAALEKGKYKDLIARVSLRPLPHHRWLGGLQLTGYAQAELPVPDTGSTHRRFGGAVTYRLADEILSPDCRLVRGDRLALWLQAFTSEEGPVDALLRTMALSGGARVELPWRLELHRPRRLVRPGPGRAGQCLLGRSGRGRRQASRGDAGGARLPGPLPQTGADEQLVGVHAELGL